MRVFETSFPHFTRHDTTHTYTHTHTHTHTTRFYCTSATAVQSITLRCNSVAG